jgi:cyclin B
MYMTNQNDINAKMRAILIDWLVEVHMKFRLVPETLYLCVNIIDRYCKKVQVRRSKLQLVGVTALLIACKYEEIYPPEVRDCVYITDRAYQSSEVLDMEQDIVHKLGFRMTVPTAYPFLQRYFTLVKASDVVKHAASYYLERTLQEHDMLKHRPSEICASAVVLALNHPEIAEEDGRTLDRRVAFLPPILLEYTGLSKNFLYDRAKEISRKIAEEPVTASNRELLAVKKKYDQRKYLFVSTEYDLPTMPSRR